MSRPARARRTAILALALGGLLASVLSPAAASAAVALDDTVAAPTASTATTDPGDLGAPALTVDPDDPADRRAAQRALDRAEQLLAPRSTGRAGGSARPDRSTASADSPEGFGVGGREAGSNAAPDSSGSSTSSGGTDTGAGDDRGADVTLALRDLALARPALEPEEQRRAARALSRPVTDSVLANADVVVHYTKAETTLDEAQATLAVVTQVHDTYLAAGFRAPKTDGVAGGDARFDVYVTDLGKTSAYGYCASDQPMTGSGSGRADRWAFCVLDNDYEGFPGSSTPTELRQVTVAHEYFHAVQFAYDAAEDGWFMEGTAAWIEDYMFDGVDDNMQYAPYSPLATPRRSLDVFEQSGFQQYGSWLFFRWLSERFPEQQAGIPTIVRDFWAAADSTTGNVVRQYSLNAIAQVLKQRGTSLAQSFGEFADANRRSASTYEEGAANGYPTAPLGAEVTLAQRGASKARSFRLDHLSSATTRFTPSRLRSSKTKLRLVVDMAAKKRGSVAVVSTYRRDGTVKTRQVKLDSRGNGRMRVPFSSREVDAVEVTLANASKRFSDCYAYSTRYSCRGKPMDQNVVQRVRGTVRR